MEASLIGQRPVRSTLAGSSATAVPGGFTATIRTPGIS
jgi:hypothetical protein